MRYVFLVFTGPNGPLQPELSWPDENCNHVTGKFTVRSKYGRDVPEPEPLQCTREPGHDGDHYTELAWDE